MKNTLKIILCVVLMGCLLLAVISCNKSSSEENNTDVNSEMTTNSVADNHDSTYTDTKSPSGENGSESTQPVGPGKVIVSGVNTDEGYGELISPNN